MTEKNDIMQDEIHKLIKQCFRKSKAGYCWIGAQFGHGTHAMGEKTLRSVIDCLTSKRDQVICSLHKRIHSAPNL